MRSSLPPIPTPLPRLWRELRIQVLPLITFAGTLAAALALWRNYIVPSHSGGAAETNTVALSSTQPGELGEIEGPRLDPNNPEAHLTFFRSTDISARLGPDPTVEADRLVRAPIPKVAGARGM